MDYENDSAFKKFQFKKDFYKNSFFLMKCTLNGLSNRSKAERNIRDRDEFQFEDYLKELVPDPKRRQDLINKYRATRLKK